LLHRVEVDERPRVVENGTLLAVAVERQVALGLCDKKGVRETDLESPLLSRQSPLSQYSRGPRGTGQRSARLAAAGVKVTMDSTTVLDLFRRCEGLLEGHFQLSSGLHSGGYLQCARVLQHPEHAATLGAALAQVVARVEPAVVLSPALGGVVIGHEVARALGMRAVFAERRDGRLTLRRGFEFALAERVLVVEDVVTTGGSTRETIEVATAAGAMVVGAAAIIDRGAEPLSFDVPFDALARTPLPTYDPAACPMCAAGQPVAKPGSRPG